VGGKTLSPIFWRIEKIPTISVATVPNLKHSQPMTNAHGIETIPGTLVASAIRREMKRLGITRPRLTRCAKAAGVTGARVNQALAGDPGWLKTWSHGALADWLEMVRTAWRF
jgi:hypothetical protein